MEQNNNTLILILKIVFGIIAFLLVFSLSVYFNNIDFNYQLDKCENLDTNTGSSYDFTNTIEIDVKYNEECFYLKNHPMARFTEVYVYAILASILSVVFTILFISLFKVMTDDPYKSSSYSSW